LKVVLGGTPGARTCPPRIDRSIIKKAFRRRAHELHPDKALAVGLPEQALARRFHELKGAYDFLEKLLGAANAAIVLEAPDLRSAAPPPPRPVSWPAERRRGIRHLGTIPKRRLRFAQYLYYAGVIDWDMMVAAMRWQRRTRPLVGDIARQMNFLSPEDVAEILRRRLADERFGEAALRLRRLDHLSLFAVLGRQSRFHRPIGRFFVEHDVLSPRDLRDLLDRHWLHNLECAAAAMQARNAYAAVG
jgi:hypothetical protein